MKGVRMESQMMDQEVINWALAALSAATGFWVKVVWDSLKELRNADNDLADKVGKIEVLVAGKYVTREEFDRAVQRLFQKLDSIELHLTGKERNS
jgi:hypothetical protein